MGRSRAEEESGEAPQAPTQALSGDACALSPQEAKSARTRAAIHEAAVSCLDDHGYPETSVLKVQALAGVSRGALTHQYPTKIEMIAAVAEKLLNDVRHTPSPRSRPQPEGDDGYVEWLLMFAWDRFVHTREGRALMEIFRATRTDPALAERLAEPVAAWTASIDRWFLRRLTAEGGEVEVRELVRLFRALSNGLAFDAGATDDDQEHLVRSLARLIAPRLRRRHDGASAAARDVGMAASGA
ncbi:MAG: TetR/AcrR family transcriptional regulator [Pseudomonadota bacterium]